MPGVWFRKVALSGAAALFLFGCGGDDDDDDNVDAGPGGVDSGACPVAEALGAFDPLPEARARHLTQDEDPAVRLVSVGGNLSDSRLDLFVIELWDGFGAFEGGQLEAGTFEIEGPETALATCGVCVALAANARAEGNQVVFDKQYVATAGTVTVDSIGTRSGNEFAGNYSGSASGLVLSEVGPDGAPVADGCRTAIESLSWDATLSNGDE